MDPLQELLNLVPPPPRPSCSQGDWDVAERSLGIVFPADYKLFIERYGYGELCSLFVIESPFGLPSLSEHWRNLFGYYEDWAGEVRTIPYPVHPEQPGLFPVGYYGDVNMIAWYTEADPDSWPIVYCDRAYGFFLLSRTGLTRFIVSVLMGTSPLPKHVIGDECRRVPLAFRPHGG